ncbi:unnamed protein product [Clonostachys chloroleuca]|uniref:Uncharacterized protein n=1 Tax=Clonostachys chloroleuca TaxID=1926264 RepID=A0AA35M1N4_9HYPO|nr:unnamed protein product [Clonostachys chloroleuca]
MQPSVFSTSEELQKLIRESPNIRISFEESEIEPLVVHELEWQPIRHGAIVKQVMSDLKPKWKKVSPVEVNARMILHVRGPLKTSPGTLQLIVPMNDPKNAFNVKIKQPAGKETEMNWTINSLFLLDEETSIQPVKEVIKYISIVMKKLERSD